MNFLMENRIFVSESNLPVIINDKWDYDFSIRDLQTEQLTHSDCELLIELFIENIIREARKVVKTVKGRIEGIGEDIMYSNLDDKDWYRAALIVEVFRDHSISKNAGSLDTRKLQEKLYSALQKNNVEFLIGWGQAKRYCGGLKTEGFSADLSELYAIMNLQIVLLSVHLICGYNVKLTVLTGGTRFYPALFTDRDAIIKYDQQRQLLVNALKIEGVNIIFDSYHNNHIEDYDKLNLFCSMTEQRDIEKIFKTILINVDWQAILTGDVLNPHGIHLPESISRYIKDKNDIDQLIMIAIVSILNRTTHPFWIDKLNNVELFDDVIDFFYQVSLVSARKYIALHLMDGDINNTSQSKLHSNAIRLTVHEKKDRRDIPALYTLGKNSGNKLSQHVCGFITKSGISFDTLLEIYSKGEKGKVKRIQPVTNGLFSWLTENDQPLFYTDLSKEEYISVIKGIRYIEE
ncbi:hypothetical protein [Pectobacterium sp. A5351]|uniref:hypothetical protein n=1 Tax=Pectobacterium sp. A5351 TaxID=2914983 RepID=UPI00232CBB09|nr:hypothetical protein [Pectobacterium sp. A5351]WCG81526.1 hypothetical protein O1Q74_11185 [Pectobacterium sp. A5351]